MELREKIEKQVKLARAAAGKLASLSSKVKNAALIAMADSLEKSTSSILSANEKDISAAKERGLTTVLIDRLALNESRMKNMAVGLREVASLPDPVGEVMRMWRRPNNLQIGKIRVPIGVIGIIYEARPNVTVDAAGLCLKSGNAVVLRGGSEAICSNIALAQSLWKGIENTGISKDAVQIIETTEREAVNILLTLDQYVDLIIPRGGEGLIRTVVEKSTIPVIKHYKGICHTYVDTEANLEMAEDIAYNAKVQRPGVCNAMETLLVHTDVAEEFIPRIGNRLREAGVEIRGCKRTREIFPAVREVKEEDWHTEYLDLILSLKVVSSLEEAIEHINTYGSSHSDAIVTDNYQNAHRFLQEVDSAAVYVNASTRFTDGYQFGLGAEIGISTDKLHARGPMGLEELTSYKFIIFGNGQIRE